MSAASRAKRRDKDLDVQVFEMGDFVSYGACGIPYFIAGRVKQLDDLVVITAEEFESKRGIKVHKRHRVEKISPNDRRLMVRRLIDDHTFEVSYDHLLIATGASPLVPPHLDTELPGVFTLRGLAEAARLKEFVVNRSPREAVIVGAGYIGLEMAECLTDAGLKVTMVEMAQKPMFLMEDEIASLIVNELAGNGVKLMLGVGAQSIQRADGKGLVVQLSSGDSLKTDLVIIGIGVKPNSELAKDAGIELGVKGAIKVNRKQLTSATNILAAGDCAECYHRILGRNTYIPLALAANRQGRVAGDIVAGLNSEFPGVLGTAISKVFDLTIARSGLSMAEATDAGIEAEKAVVSSNSLPHYYPGGARITSVVLIDKKDGRLIGVQMAGKHGVGQRINTWATALTAGMSLDEIAGMDLAYAPPYSPVWDPVLVAAEVANKRRKA